jgi:hypothetical protein
MRAIREKSNTKPQQHTGLAECVLFTPFRTEYQNVKMTSPLIWLFYFTYRPDADWLIDCFYVVRLRLWTAATNGHIVHPTDMGVCRATVEWYWQGKTEEFGEKPVPVPLHPPQIPHGMARTQTRDRAVKDRWLTAWPMARPVMPITHLTIHWTAVKQQNSV